MTKQRDEYPEELDLYESDLLSEQLYKDESLIKSSY
jgi:hypothetical protein